MTSEREKRLPLWAQDDLRELRSEVQRLAGELASRLGEHPKSRTFVDPLQLRRAPHYYDDGDGLCVEDKQGNRIGCHRIAALLSYCRSPQTS